MPSSAQVVIAQPLSVVESQLWDVSSWVGFLGELEQVRRCGHNRYRIVLRHGLLRRDALLRVRWHASQHLFSWQTVEGPSWSGRLSLRPLNGRRTVVVVTLDPTGPRLAALAGRVAATLAGALSTGRRRPARIDLDRLRGRLHVLPPPPRPARLPAGDGRTVQDVEGMVRLARPPRMVRRRVPGLLPSNRSNPANPAGPAAAAVAPAPAGGDSSGG